MSTSRVFEFLHQTTSPQFAAIKLLTSLPDILGRTCRQTRLSVQQWGWKPWIVFFTAIVGLATIVGMCLAIAVLPSSVQSEQLAAWDANKEFRAWCQGESDAVKTLTTACEKALQSALEPPPGSAFGRRVLRSLLRRWIVAGPVGQKQAYNIRVIVFDVAGTILILVCGSIFVVALLEFEKFRRWHDWDVEHQHNTHSSVDLLGMRASSEATGRAVATGIEITEGPRARKNFAFQPSGQQAEDFVRLQRKWADDANQETFPSGKQQRKPAMQRSTTFRRSTPDAGRETKLVAKRKTKPDTDTEVAVTTELQGTESFYNSSKAAVDNSQKPEIKPAGKQLSSKDVPSSWICKKAKVGESQKGDSMVTLIRPPNSASLRLRYPSMLNDTALDKRVGLSDQQVRSDDMSPQGLAYDIGQGEAGVAWRFIQGSAGGLFWMVMHPDCSSEDSGAWLSRQRMEERPKITHPLNLQLAASGRGAATVTSNMTLTGVQITRLSLCIKDKLGRIFVFTLRGCDNWNDVRQMTCDALAHFPLAIASLDDGLYDLFDNENQLVPPRMWGEMARPGLNITMRLREQQEAFRPAIWISDGEGLLV